ncbi:hypothetical protein KC865_02555 [Candidatus Kaiserbacteria bacterium]|nr:hypothetical protein [Candidatus Kaiserbacteria bacterium]USN91867.1 MAG: hypothetical protein H6782_03260 [Candidatus Nomurabacteria bacterium]
MTIEPQIGELSHKRRQRFFFVLVFIFILALPALIFYTTGYRLSFENEETSIVSTGGIYVTTDNLEVSVYIDDKKEEKPRLFRSAYYIQNIASGQHRIVVQRPDLYTWVKVLPVDPHIVIEASSFNMPLLPHLRPITRYTTKTNMPVFFVSSTSIDVLPGATSTIPYLLATSTATSTFNLNEEYIFVESLFSTTSTSSKSVFDIFLNNFERFGFATSSSGVDDYAPEEEFIRNGNSVLIERDNELYVVWQGGLNNIPHYFCVSGIRPSSTAKRYGQHVADEIKRMSISTSSPLLIDGNRVCRSEIKLDRLRQDVYFYDFFPDNSDLVLLQLEDGLYVTEIDDRSWQNSQMIYPGKDFRVVVENNAIFIEKNEMYFEIITEIEPK